MSQGTGRESIDRSAYAAVPFAAMKKRAAKTKGSAKAKRAAKPSAGRSARTTTASATSRAASYTPAPLKSDGWPPFRYNVQ